MIALTRKFGRFGYRRIAVMLCNAGWEINDKRVERLWRREGLKVPMKQPKKGHRSHQSPSGVRGVALSTNGKGKGLSARLSEGVKPRLRVLAASRRRINGPTRS